MASVTQVPFTAADIFKWVSYGPCVIRRVWGYNNQAATVYIQFHQVPPLGTLNPYTNLANGTVPTCKSLVAFANNGFDYAHEDISLSECTVCLSTTEVNLTAVAGSGGLDMTIEVDTMYPLSYESRGDAATATFVSIVGDMTTGRDNLVGWSDSNVNAAARLLRVTYTNNDGGPRYLQLFADTSAVNPTPIQVWTAQTAAANKVVDVFFGTRGMPVYIADRSVGTAATQATGEHWGCFLAQSSTGPTLTATSSAVSTIRALVRLQQ